MPIWQMLGHKHTSQGTTVLMGVFFINLTVKSSNMWLYSSLLRTFIKSNYSSQGQDDNGPLKWCFQKYEALKSAVAEKLPSHTNMHECLCSLQSSRPRTPTISKDLQNVQHQPNVIIFLNHFKILWEPSVHKQLNKNYPNICLHTRNCASYFTIIINMQISATSNQNQTLMWEF